MIRVLVVQARGRKEDSVSDKTELTKIQFHPDAPRPRFMWQADLPTTWVYLDTHPEASVRQAEIIAENYIPGHRFKRAEQKLIIRQLESAIIAARKAKALLTLILPGVNEAGEPSAATLILRWYDSSPDMSSMATIKRAFEKKSAVMEEATTTKGSAYVMTAETTKTGPLDNRRDAYHRQAFIPLAGTTWTLVASGTTPDPDSDAVMKDAISRLVNSIKAYPESYGERLPDVETLGEDEQTVQTESVGEQVVEAQNHETQTDSVAKTSVNDTDYTFLANVDGGELTRE
ncbi:hypothetical protein CAURIC_00590 [Corynebacterium auriscanis]|uniref:Uncharacterized protein n=1 Tax=Corynebacterium auriscanis TaxID=99807 RepID=A0A0A2DH14_9CORY|nr:hypothetical protein MA47_07615 [Corynebacterium auriscanis]WJY71802.1 hypothetical protein CAURIC_00590 [Corynebacterium auriscanis]